MSTNETQQLLPVLQPLYSFVDGLLDEIEMERTKEDREVLCLMRNLFKEIYSLKGMITCGDYFSEVTINNEIEIIKDIAENLSREIESSERPFSRWKRRIRQAILSIRSLPFIDYQALVS